MKKLFLSIVSALLCVTAQADVGVYKIKITQTDTGEGRTVKTNFVGFVVFDGSGSFTFAAGNTATKKYRTFQPASAEAANIFTKTGTGTFLRISDEADIFGGLRAKGADTKPFLANGLVPGSMKVSGSEIVGQGPLSLYHVIEHSGTLIFDAKKSIEYTGMGLDMAGAIGLLTTQLLGLGYLPE